MKHFLSLAMLMFLVGPLSAQTTFVTDAFGVYISQKENGDRETWSGLHVTMDTMGGPTEKVVSPAITDIIQLFLDGKRYQAGEGNGSVIALLQDTIGNAVIDGTQVEFILSNGGRIRAETMNGVAQAQFPVGTKTGIFYIAAQTFLPGTNEIHRQSRRTEYRVMANITLVTPSFTEPEEHVGEAVYNLATGILTDKYGNTLENGMELQTILSHPGSSYSIIQSSSASGGSSAQILTRGLPPLASAVTFLGTNASDITEVVLLENLRVSNLSVAVFPLGEIGATRLEIGPFLTRAGHFQSDDTEVSLVINDALAKTTLVEGRLADGYYSIVTSLMPEHFPVDISVTTRFGTETLTGISVSAEPVVEEGAE